MSVAAPKCNILKFVSEYTTRRSLDIPVNNLLTDYLKQDFLSRNPCDTKFGCILPNDNCDADIIHVVPDTCTCPIFVGGYTTKVGPSYYANFSFDLTNPLTCPFQIVCTTPFSSVTIGISGPANFSSHIGNIYTRTFLIGGFPDLNFYIRKLDGTICEPLQPLLLCNAPTIQNATLTLEDDVYSINIIYNTCGDNCHSITWDYEQLLPNPGDTGSFTDTVDCDSLPQEFNHTVRPIGPIPPGDTVKYKLTGTDCCGNITIINVIYVTPPDDSLLLYQSPWKAQGSPTFIPYAIPSWAFNNGILSTIVIPIYIIYTLVQEDAMIIAINGIILAGGYTGTVSRDIGGTLYYHPGLGETPSIVSAIYVLWHYYTIKYDATVNGNVLFKGDRLITGLGLQLIDWADGNISYYSPAGAGLYDITHSYTIGTIVDINVFHDEFTQDIRFSENLAVPPRCKLLSVTNELPLYLKRLYLFVSPFFGSLTGYVTSLPIIRNANNLEQFLITQTNVIAFSTGMFNANFIKLQNIAFVQNKLSSSAVDNVINELVTNTPTPIVSGSFSINAQTPPAPPTGASLTSRTFLSSTPYFWTVTTD